jgi:hypothetical protein
MLLNEFLKKHRKVRELAFRLVKQHKQIESLSAGLQEVSVRFEMSKPAPEVAVTNQ